MQLTDTHIHLYAEEFSETLDKLLEHAISLGITKFVIPNIDSSSLDAMFTICKKYPKNCFPTLGLHPCYVKANYVEELQTIKAKAETEKIYAIGEIGMDLYWDKTFIAEQEHVFRLQIEWAMQLKLPIIIHSRESTKEIIGILQDYPNQQIKGIFHCFSGSIEQAEKIIALGFYLGIGGVVTFKNSGLDKVVQQFSPEYFVLETDAPYLAPAPHRGKINEPAYLMLVALKLAEIKQLPLQTILDITSQNAKQLFSF